MVRHRCTSDSRGALGGDPHPLDRPVAPPKDGNHRSLMNPGDGRLAVVTSRAAEQLLPAVTIVLTNRLVTVEPRLGRWVSMWMPTSGKI